MLCPNCKIPLTEKKIGDITVDVCTPCGGLWFDNFELSKMDEAHETAGEELTRTPPPFSRKASPTEKHPCLKCEGVTMRRFFASVNREIEIDECPQCAGTWLDGGELASLRAQFKTDEERKKAALAYFSENFEQKLHAQAGQTAMDTAQKQQIARAFRYVLPSYWIPGKQKGGAF